MAKALKYTNDDFEVLEGEATGDRNITYVFKSKDGKVTANFFFIPGDVETRGLIWKGGDIAGTFQIGYPFANPVGNPQKAPKSNVILRSICTRLKHGQYEAD